MIRRLGRISALAYSLLLSQAGALMIAEDGRPASVIVVESLATPVEKHAAEELAEFLWQVSGARFEIAAERRPGQSNLLVGMGAGHMADPELTADGLGPEGIIIRTVGNDLILAGGPVRGALYAVYTFLEDEIGCRWWSHDAGTIPSKPTISIGSIDVRYAPILEYRETDASVTATDPAWSARNKCNGAAHFLRADQGGRYLFEPHFCHTFYMLLPPEKYFEDHPEWFSLRGGERFAGSGNDITLVEASLCLTNEEMRKTLVENLKQVLREQQDGTEHAWHNHENGETILAEVSPPDSAGKLWCECDQCTAVEEAEGSPAGLMIRFVNAVSEDLKDEFPDVLVSTLAYHDTRKPPWPSPDRTKITKTSDDVIVRLSTIKCSFGRPFTHANNTAVYQDLLGWSKVCSRLHVWDYVVNHTYAMLPHPNLRVLAPNIREYIKLGVTGYYGGAERNPAIEVAELRAWMVAKLMWDPSLDGQELIETFCRGFYGAAGRHVVAYLDVMHDAVEKTDDWLGLSSPPTADFLALETLDRGWAHLEAAASAVVGDEELSGRVERVRRCVRYAYAQRGVIGDMVVSASSSHRSRVPVNAVIGIGLDADARTHNANPEHAWLSEKVIVSDLNPHPGTVPGSHWFKVEFVEPKPISEMLIWNYNEEKWSAHGMKNITIQYSLTDGPDRSEWATIYEGELPIAPESKAAPASLAVDFGSAEVKSVVITSGKGSDMNWSSGALNSAGLSEILFRETGEEDP